MNELACTVVILTYKGKQHLEHLLPTVREAVARTSPRFRVNVFVLDNGTDKPTADFVRTHFPEFTYMESPVNDYLFSLNPFVAAVKDEFTLILNDDMKMHPQALNRMLEVIESDARLFSVTCNIMDWDGARETTGIRSLETRKGWFILAEHAPESPGTFYTLFAGGGAAVFRTEMYNRLGGFDPLFRPAYSEDADLSLRAWRRGWPTVYHTDAVLYHRISATIRSQLDAERFDRLTGSHHIILCLRNMQSRRFLAAFFLLLPYRLLISARFSRTGHAALKKALRKMPTALARRFADPADALTWAQIQSCIGKRHEA